MSTKRLISSAAAAVVAASVMIVPVAQAQSPAPSPPRYIGNPVAYTIDGQPTPLTTLNVSLAVSSPLPPTATVSVITAGGRVLGSAPATSIGRSGLCYTSRIALDAPISRGGVLRVGVYDGSTPLLPIRPQVVRGATTTQGTTPEQVLTGVATSC